MSNEVIKFLDNFTNRSEKTKDLLKLYLDITGSQAGAIFIAKDNLGNFECIEHCGKKCDNKAIKFTTKLPVKSFSFSADGYDIPYKIKSSLSILITNLGTHIGLVSLFNKSGGYTEDIIRVLGPCISITQLVLSKKQLNIENKKRYNSNPNNQDLFLANMSHEIRTPANGVIGYGQLLMQTTLSPVQKAYLKSQNQCCIQLMQIINDVLDFSKLSSGKMGSHKQCFSPQEIIESVKNTIGGVINDKKQKIKFNVNSEVPPFMIMDRYKLIQILINLISNANKFSDIGETIDVIFNIVNKNQLQIKVIDNGVGISLEDQSKLFVAFEQIHASLCKTGTGLGLAISDKLVELLGGNIQVESTLGLGSIFTITLPFIPYDEFENIISKDSVILKGKWVLVVDDNADNRIIISDMLFEWGMNPIIVSSALEALRMILNERYTFSIGLIDICMPGTSGSELAKQIKEEKPLFPMVALSSIDTFVTTQDFEHKLDKPINRVQLFETLCRIISKKQVPSAYIGESDEESSESSTSSKHSTNINILIVEDISYNRTMLENMLEIMGYLNISSASDGKMATEMIIKAQNSNQPYDVILLDLRMPILDGYGVIDFIKKDKNILSKIIVVTASVMDDDKQKCKRKGVKYFVNKPIIMSQLKEVLLHSCLV